MPKTEHANLREIAEQLTGESLPRLTTNSYIEIIEQNIGRQQSETVGADTTVTDPNLDTLAVDTSDGPVNITIAPEFEVTGTRLTVVDISNNAVLNNITITRDNGTIANLASVTIDTNGGVAVLEVVELLDGTLDIALTATVGSIL